MESKIKHWLKSVLSDDTTSNDLHIDDIDSKYDAQKEWFSGSFSLISEVIASRNEVAKTLELFLVFDLLGDSKPLGVNFRNLDELQTQFSFTPPSFYSFKKTALSKLFAENHFKELDRYSYNFFPKQESWQRLFYVENQLVSDEDYSRSLWFQLI